MSENKRINDRVMWIIVALLSFILIVLVFKAGVLVGGGKSHFSSHRSSGYSKSIGGDHFFGSKKSMMMDRKAMFEAFQKEAQASGMTIEEYKKSLLDQKTAN